jgi:hypothetical protein
MHNVYKPLFFTPVLSLGQRHINHEFLDVPFLTTEPKMKLKMGLILIIAIAIFSIELRP